MALILGECLIRPIRESKGYTQDFVATEIRKKYGLSVSTTLFGQYERKEKFPGPLNSRAICKILGCCEMDLYEFIET